jgi:hypothetical protein
VVRCHEPGDGPFPCAALVEGRSCPLEGAPVDVAVTARDRPWPRPSPYEDGAVCALRRNVPLVVTGVGVSLDPFEKWATAETDRDEDLVTACEAAAIAPMARHGEVASAAAREILDHAGCPPDEVDAKVCRQRGGLRVELVLPPAADDCESAITARVLTALRALDPHATGIDISRVRSAPTAT